MDILFAFGHVDGTMHPKAWGDFREWLELMGTETHGDDEFPPIKVDFVPNTPQAHAECAERWFIPAGITPIFITSDMETSMGFSMLHGVCEDGSPWDSEGGAG